MICRCPPPSGCREHYTTPRTYPQRYFRQPFRWLSYWKDLPTAKRWRRCWGIVAQQRSKQSLRLRQLFHMRATCWKNVDAANRSSHCWWPIPQPWKTEYQNSYFSVRSMHSSHSRFTWRLHHLWMKKTDCEASPPRPSTPHHHHHHATLLHTGTTQPCVAMPQSIWTRNSSWMNDSPMMDTKPMMARSIRFIRIGENHNHHCHREYRTPYYRNAEEHLQGDGTTKNPQPWT